jgi:hypothetical protein
MTTYICVFRHKVVLRSNETNNWIRGIEVACLLSNVHVWGRIYSLWHTDGGFFCHLTLSFALWYFLHRHHYCFADTQCYLVYHLHKEVPFAGCLVQWTSWAVRLTVQKTVKLFSLGVCHQNNLCIIICVPYFFTLWSRHGKTCGPTYRIKNCSQWGHVFQCGSPSALSRKEIMHTIAWHEHLLHGAPTPASRQCGVPITVSHIQQECSCSDKCQIFSWWGSIMWHPGIWRTWICSWCKGGRAYLTHSVLFSLSNSICIVVSRISLGHTFCLTVIS